MFSNLIDVTLLVEDAFSKVVDMFVDVIVGFEETFCNESSEKNKSLNDCYSFDVDDDGVLDERGNKNSFGLTFYWEERVPLSIAPSNAVNLLMETPQKF